MEERGNWEVKGRSRGQAWGEKVGSPIEKGKKIK